MSGTQGMDAAQLRAAIGQIVDPATTEKARKTLLRSLNPVGEVPVDCVMSLLGAFASFKPEIRMTVLKWIALVMSWVDDFEVLHSMFPVLFHYIDYDNLRYAFTIPC